MLPVSSLSEQVKTSRPTEVRLTCIHAGRSRATITLSRYANLTVQKMDCTISVQLKHLHEHLKGQIIALV